MSQEDIVNRCKELGCCDACCIRYLGLKTPTAYENQQFILKFNIRNKEVVDKCNPITELKTENGTNSQDHSSKDVIQDSKLTNVLIKEENVVDDTLITKEYTDMSVVKEENNITEPIKRPNDNPIMSEPAAKRIKTEHICVSCLGVLQPVNWEQCYEMVKEILDKKQYESKTFACALSAPIATIVRERYICLKLKESFPNYDDTSLTPLKEAWKWSFGSCLADQIHMTLDSGAVSPLLITLNIEYPDDLQELEVLKSVSPSLFEARSRQRRRFAVQFTRRAAEQALGGAGGARLLATWGPAPPPASARAACVSVVATHEPIYLGGRYIKLSRTLPQTPWLVGGRRMMHSSVQEIIGDPIAELYSLSVEEREHRLKFISAGREDVDVRCLGDGRPFALEITDPHRQPTQQELELICKQISEGGQVVVKILVPVSREDLTLLKKGEETKCKTYEALCIKLSHSEEDQLAANGDTRISVTQRDLDNINSYRNTEGPERVLLQQRTPLRVLHRRPLLVRTRRILELTAHAVPDNPQLFIVRIRTEAGTYVKEWAHGELGRTRPRLADALRAKADILALDVASVELQWPIIR